MPVYTYSIEKNHRLIKERNISFEEIIAAIENNQILDIVEHPNQEKYMDQKIYVIWAKNYVYLVPFIKDNEDNLFLKTIIPSRKAVHTYLKKNTLDDF